MNKVKKLVFSGLCAAIGVILPLLLHGIPNAGSVLLPMHIPVLLCGLVCGPWFGLGCGLLTPLLSSLLTGMPSAAYLPAMLCELAVYGLIAGLFMRFIRTRSTTLNVCLALISAMLLGRIIYGIVNAIFFRAGEYSMVIWLSSAFVTALPGIVIQLVLLPTLILLLEKTGVISLK